MHLKRKKALEKKKERPKRRKLAKNVETKLEDSF